MASLMVSSCVGLMGNVMVTSSSSRKPTFCLAITNERAALGFRGQQQRVFGAATARKMQRNFLVFCGVQPGIPPPPADGNSPGSLAHWIFGIVISVVIPFFTHRWTNLLKIKGEVDTVVHESEKVAECVEEVAETVDKVAKDIADHLPQGGKLRDAAEFVEGVAEEIAKDAHLVEDFLHKVEEVEDKVESLNEAFKHQKEEDVTEKDVTDDQS